jgi:NDP-sugar pyrophosphorylase family protein
VGKARLVFLAAGEGKRLRPLTDETPKALLEFGGLSITERIITRHILSPARHGRCG